MSAPGNPVRAELEGILERHVERYFPGRTARSRRRAGFGVVLDWLEGAGGSSWQERWEELGETSEDWLADVGAATARERTEAFVALQTLILEGFVRPSYAWLLRVRLRLLYHNLRSTVQKEAFDALLAVAPGTGASAATVKQALVVLSRIVVHTGKGVREVTTEDVLSYGEAVRATGRNASGVRVAHRLLRAAGCTGDPPLTSGYGHRLNRLSVEQSVDRHGIECGEVRDLLVEYLKERSAALDYPSAKQLADRLAGKFWRDIELHHPGIGSIDLPAGAAEAWRKRSETLPDGRPRKDFNELFVVVRSFYLDILQWAAEDPERWEKYACPSPISAAHIRAYRKPDCTAWRGHTSASARCPPCSRASSPTCGGAWGPPGSCCGPRAAALPARPSPPGAGGSRGSSARGPIWSAPSAPCPFWRALRARRTGGR